MSPSILGATTIDGKRQSEAFRQAGRQEGRHEGFTDGVGKAPRRAGALLDTSSSMVLLSLVRRRWSPVGARGDREPRQP
jgi:hypothetical protein